MNGKRLQARGRRRLLLFFAVSLPVLGFLIFSLITVGEIDPEMDEALFHRAGADSALHILTRDEEEGWRETLIYPAERCFPLLWEDVPPHLAAAFVAMEDHRFYRHGGVDVIRTLKAAGSRFFGKGDFGGSTITQQLIKNIGGERERTVSRKLREMMRAHALEARHTKEEILLAYLNIVPMGGGCVGVGAAARMYFGKEAKALTLAEAASLAAAAPAPARLSPAADKEANLKRRNRVLLRMQELGFIDDASCRRAMAEPLITLTEGGEERTPLSHYNEYLLRCVREELVARGYTEAAAYALLYRGGVRIYSACDERAQASAEAAFRSFAGAEGLHAGAVIFSPETGKPVALVGDLGEGEPFGAYSFATDARRAPGSALKPPALYAPAIDEGLITEATVFDDVPKQFTERGMWPHNTPDRYDGLILAKDALIHSKNTVAVDLYRRLGAEHIYATLTERFRLTGLCRRKVSANGNVLTDLAAAPLALGELTYGVSLYELTRAYLPFAAEGILTVGHPYFRVEDAEGRVLLLAEDEHTRVLSRETAGIMTHMLSGVAEEGSAKSLSLPEIVDVAGKTGSSGGNRDRWFIGYTPAYLCGIWCGYESGGTSVEGVPHLALFDAVMTPLHNTLTEEGRSFSYAGLRRVTVCKDSGKMPTVLCKEDERGERTTEVLLAQGTRLDACKTHVSVFYDDEAEGVVYPPYKGSEGRLRRVSLIRVDDRAFPREVTVADAEYVYRDPKGADAPEGDAPFFAAVIPEGVYIGKSHDGRPFHAAAHRAVPPYLSDVPEEMSPPVKRERRERRIPRLPRFPFFGF